MDTWKFFSKIPFCSISAVQNYIIEDKFQFIVVQFKIWSLYFSRVYRGNTVDFAEPFLTFLGSLGAKVETFRYNNRKNFELIAAQTPVLKRLHFDWNQLHERRI